MQLEPRWSSSRPAGIALQPEPLHCQPWGGPALHGDTGTGPGLAVGAVPGAGWSRRWHLGAEVGGQGAEPPAAGGK